MTPDEALKLRVLATVRQHPVPIRRDGILPAVAPAALAALAMLAAFALWALFTGSARATGRPESSGAWIVAGTVALAIAATRLALPSSRSMLSPARGRLLAVALGVPLLVGAWLVLWHTSYDDPYTRVGLRCLGLTALTAPWPFLALLRASRRLEPRHPGLAGAALGSAAGAWAAVMVELWCPLAVLDHVLVGHVLPLLALALAGAAVGARTFRLQRVR